MIDLVPIFVGDGAPAGCVRCGAAGASTYLPVETIAAAIAQTVPADGVVLTGPEPFAHPDLPRVVAACRDAGVSRIAIETDGGALSVPGNAHGVLLSGVRHLWVRVLGSSDEMHDTLAGKRGIAQAMRAGVAGYLANAETERLQVAVTAVVPVCEHDLAELPAIMAHCAAQGFHAARLVAAGALPSSAETIVAAACDTGMVNHLWVAVDESLPLPPSHRLHGEVDGGPGASSRPEAGESS